MKRRIDLKSAAEAERFGALAVAANHRHRNAGDSGDQFTPAQNRAVADLARSLVRVAKKAGAENGRITVGDVSLELRENGNEEILSIRRTTSAIRSS
jgi:hypothetical protein